MTIGIGEIPLALARRCAVALPRQPSAWHRLSRERFQIWRLQACFLGGLNGLLLSGSGFRSCCLSPPVQFHLLTRWCSRFLGGVSLGSGLISFFLTLTRCGSGGLRFHLLAGLTDPLQTVLAATQFIRKITSAVVLAVTAIVLGVQDFGLAHQGINLLRQLLFGPQHPLVAHGLVLAGVGFDLGAIQCHMAQADHASLLAQPQGLNKQTLEGVKVAATELADPAVVRLLIAGEHAKSQILVAGPLDLPRRHRPHAVGVEQQQRQHPRVVPLLAAGILGLSRDQDLREIQFLRQVQQEIHLVILGQPLTRRGRQQGGLIRLPGAEGLGLLHAPFSHSDPLQSLQFGRI